MACSFEKLVLYLDKQLDIDGQLEVLNHIDECDVCQDAVYQIRRDRDYNLIIRRPYKLEKIPVA